MNCMHQKLYNIIHCTVSDHPIQFMMEIFLGGKQRSSAWCGSMFNVLIYAIFQDMSVLLLEEYLVAIKGNPSLTIQF